MIRAALPLLLAVAALAAMLPADARTHRSSSARSAFKHSHTCPSTGRHGGRCPGYVIDHVQALDCGGADAPGNMQWQTTSAARAKDEWEREGASCQHRQHRR